MTKPKRALILLAILVAMCGSVDAQVPSSFPYVKPAPNDTATGTTQFKLTKINASGNAVIMAISDINGYSGICISNCGTSGTAYIAFAGFVPLVVDGTTTADHYVTISSSNAGQGHDTGSTSFPSSGAVIGRVVQASTGGGSVSLIDLGPEIQSLTSATITVNTVPCSVGGSCTAYPVIAITNAASTGTTANTLTKLTGAPSTAVISSAGDTGGVVGIVISGAGTAGSATIQTQGLVNCAFDGSTTAGDYISISASTAGDCHDAGSTYPTSAYIVGRVLSTNGSSGVYLIDLFSPEIRGSSGGGGSSALSSITAATASNTIANGNNPQVWNFAQTTNSQTAFKFGETSAATGTTDIELGISTLAGSTAVPVSISGGAGGSGAAAQDGLDVTTGAGGAASSVTSAGNNGGAVGITTGAGSAGGATSGTGGNGGAFNLTTGSGGNATAGSTNGNGGNVVVSLGAAGTGGTASLAGQFNISSPSTSTTNPGLSVQQATAAVSNTNLNSPTIELSANYFNSVSLRDTWEIQNVIGSGNGNPFTTLTFSHSSGTSSTQAINFLGVQNTSARFQGTGAGNAVTYMGGQDSGNPAGLLAGPTLRGADVTSGASASNAGGVVTIRGGNDGGTSTSSKSGNVVIEPGVATGVTSASSSWGTIIFDSISAFNTGTTNVGDLACVTASQTVASCATAAANNQNIGIIQATATNSVYVQTQGLASVNSNASASFTFGDYVCVDTSNAGKVVDGGTTACTNGQGVGIVFATDSSVTSHSIVLRHF